MQFHGWILVARSDARTNRQTDLTVLSVSSSACLLFDLCMFDVTLFGEERSEVRAPGCVVHVSG